jgi:hypothetical protein
MTAEIEEMERQLLAARATTAEGFAIKARCTELLNGTHSFDAAIQRNLDKEELTDIAKPEAMDMSLARDILEAEGRA